MAGVGLRGSLALSVFSYLIWTVIAAPVDEGTSHALQISESYAEVRGCYYNFEHYGEGDRILTNEPCLNCTCHNRMLMCYLRVCPFTKAIGQDCTIEKKPDQCCPVITCPQVPVALLTSSTTSEAPQTTTALGRLDNYGCLLEDNTFYADGAQVPSDPRKPCELCYCIRNHTACVMQECTLNVEGCKPVYQEGVCCPVRYDCDYDDVATTPKPTIGLVTTPGGPSDCLHNGHIYHDGAMVMKDEKTPCEHCYCMRGDIVCAVQECGTPLEGTNCVPMEPKRGQCCPNYECTNGTYSTENYFSGLSSSTETIPESVVTESSKHEKPESDESSNEADSNESSEESNEGSGSDIVKPAPEELPSQPSVQETSSVTPEKSEVSNDSSAPSSGEQDSKQPETNESGTPETPVLETNGQTADSISEATQDQDVTHPHEVPLDLGNNVKEQENTPKPDVSIEQEDETTKKQEISPQQDVTNMPEATKEQEEVTQSPESSHENESQKEPIHEQNDNTKVQETIHNQEVIQETPVTDTDTAKDHETSEHKDGTHQDTNEKEVSSAQAEVTNIPDVNHEQETSNIQDITHEQDVTHFQEETTHIPDAVHEQENSSPQDGTHGQEVVTQLPENSHTSDSPIVQQAAHEQGVTHEQEEATHAQEEATHSPDVTHEHENPDVQDATHEQDEKHVQEEVTKSPEINHEQSSTAPEATQEQEVTHVHEEVTQVPEATHAPQVSNEQETSHLPEDTHDQEVTQQQEGTNIQEITNAQEAIIEHSTAKQEIQTQAPEEIVKDSQVTNEIPESTPPEQSEPSTEQPAIEVARVPGEGSCLVDGNTYAHNSIISSENPCHEECRCYSSIVTCKTKECTPPPTQYEHCEPVITPGSCCPTYLCDQKPSDAPEAHSQLSDHTGDAPHNDIPEETAGESVITTQPSVESGHKDNSVAPVVEGIPSETLHPGTPEENHEETDTPTTEKTGVSADISPSNINEVENVNSHVVHGADAAVHEGELEVLDNKLQSGSRPHDSEDATVIPIIPEKPAEETVTLQEPETPNADHTEEAPVKYEDETVPNAEVSPQAPIDVTSRPKPIEEESAPTQETPVVSSEDSEKNHPEIPETTVNYQPEETTAHHGLQESHDSHVPSSSDNVVAEDNSNDVTSSDSTIDESKHEESIVTIKPTEINKPQESEGGNTEPDHITTEDPFYIPDQFHSIYDDDPAQIAGAILFQQTESETLSEASTETSVVSGDPHAPSVSNDVPVENQNTVSEENVPSETEVPPKLDSEAEANQVSSVSIGNQEIVTHLPHVTEEVSYETTSKPSTGEEPSSSSSDDKATQTPMNHVPMESTHETSHSSVETTTSVIQAINNEETLPNAETSKDENKEEDSNNRISSSTEDTKPDNQTTHPPVVTQDENKDISENSENSTPQEKPEQTSEENIHHDEVSHSEPNLTEEAHAEDKPTQEIHEQDVVEQTTNEGPLETSSEGVKIEKPEATVHHDENNVNADSSPQVIFEEVTVTGMPSIESHVTEGTVDHSVNIINNLLDSDIVHTTEHTAPVKEPTVSNEVLPEAVNTETPLGPIVETEKTIFEQPAEDNTASPSQDEQNMEDIHHDTTSSHEIISSSESINQEIVTTPKPSVEELSHQEAVSEDEGSSGTNEAHSVEPIPSEEITSSPIKNDDNDNSNQVLSEESTSAPTDLANTVSHEQPASVLDDQKNEETSPEVSPVENSQPIGESDGETAITASDQGTTAIPSVETIHPETNLNENVEANNVNQPHTDAPLEDETVNQGDTEQRPSEVQTELEEASHIDHGGSSIINNEPTDSPTTNAPVQTLHETSQDVTEAESSPGPNQNEILQQETTEAPVQTNQSENTSELSSHTDDSEDAIKETASETSQNQTEPPSENTEVPASDNNEHLPEVSTEHMIQPESEQNATPSSSNADLESSTSHDAVVSQTENVLSPSTGGSNEILQSTGDKDDSSTQTPQVTHLEHEIPPAPDSDSHILETSENEGESATPAAAEQLNNVEQSTDAGQTTVSENNQQNVEESHHNNVPQTPAETEPEQPIVNEPVPEDPNIPTTHIPELTETSSSFINHESSTIHHDTLSQTSPSSEPTNIDIPSSTEHPSSEEIQTTPKESVPETQKIETVQETEKPADNVPVTESTSSVPSVSDKIEEHVPVLPDDTKVPSTPSTEGAPLIEIPSSTYKPAVVHHEESPSFPSWSQKPFEHHTTPEPHPPEENHYPSGYDPEYEDEEGVSYGPGTCRYGGKVYLSAQQIPRDDPCDFCFCFRSDIICLQQSCPPPIRGCYQETIKGFCCPRYECHVSMATMLNITTTTTTTTTTLPPHFLSHAYNGAAMKAGCQVKDVAYSVGERIPSTSGPCLECRCGANGQMKCDPTVCGPQEALLRQVMDAAVSRRR